MKYLVFLLFPLFLHAVILQDEVRRDLQAAGFPPAPEKIDSSVLDVAIIGGGHSGLSLCLALRKNGIFNTAIFDKAPEGREGPWLTTARMETLRSFKEIPGPSLGLPHLAFQAWYEAQWSDWDSFRFIPTPLWAAYLHWYRTVLGLPVRNGWELVRIEPEDGLLKLVFTEDRIVRCRKIVLATGRAGFGGCSVPPCVSRLPKEAWSHTGEEIDPQAFQGKRIVVLGAGASAYDAAGCALENGAVSVQMIMRRAELPTRLPFSECPCWAEYASWDDSERLGFFDWAWKEGIRLPASTLARVEKWPNFELLKETCIESIEYDGQLRIMTNSGGIMADLLIAATGYAADVEAVPEIAPFADQILCWGNKLQGCSDKAACFPYLGRHFEFLEKNPGKAPFLKNVHCFNYGAFLSQGRIAGDIDVLGIGVQRLAYGIALELQGKEHLPVPSIRGVCHRRNHRLEEARCGPEQ